jgi:WD40 repeat protein
VKNLGEEKEAPPPRRGSPQAEVNMDRSRLLLTWYAGRRSIGLEKCLLGHKGWVWGVALTPDGRRAVSSGYGGAVTVWDLSQGREERTLAGHRGRVSDVALSPDGSRTVSVGFDGMLKIWDTESGEELASVNLDHTLKYVSLTPDGTRILVADAAGNLTCFSLS